MIIRSVNLETVCGPTSVFPKNTLPEVAFAGKSNVGKSSLINALMNRKAYARTSEKPGKTQTVNFYNINQELYYVDLPGYGYAAMPEKEKQKMGKMVEAYLKSSEMLREVFLLIDIRHDPGANDKLMYEWVLSEGYRPFIVATKLDKIKRSEIAKKVKAIRVGLNADLETQILPFSSVTKQGREELWAEIERVTGSLDAADRKDC